ncbi:MAG TPA: SDR family oxidoreductase [Roseomonas sp.]|jgi:NAD(P)-dependent dehydrogenase (short-subunit alcohol dehydrogenase family)
MMRTWFITGASRGIGRQMTEQLLARGERVVATARRIEELQALAAAHDGRLHAARLDVTDTAAIRRVVAEAVAMFGRIDVLVSNAGVAVLGAAEELEDDGIDRQLATNLVGPIQLMRAVLPHFRAQGAGRIIQVSSEGGQMAFPSLSLYHATKWGIEGFCESLMLEVAPFDIRVTLVQPGHLDTGFDDQLLRAGTTIEAYQKTTVGHYRRLHAMGRFPRIGDSAKVAAAILALADLAKPPKRLTLGSDAYRNLHRALTARLAELESQKDSAPATDRDQSVVG